MKNYIKLIHVARRATFECPVCGRISCLGRDSPTVCSSCKSMMVALGSTSYRGVLRTLTGKESTKDMDEDELEKVYTFFRQAGFCPTRGADAVEREYETGRRKTVGVILSTARKVLGSGWQKRLNAFVASQNGGKTDLYKLSDAQQRQVIGWLRREAKSQAKRKLSNIEEMNKWQKS